MVTDTMVLYAGCCSRLAPAAGERATALPLQLANAGIVGVRAHTRAVAVTWRPETHTMWCSLTTTLLTYAALACAGNARNSLEVGDTKTMLTNQLFRATVSG